VRYDHRAGHARDEADLLAGASAQIAPGDPPPLQRPATMEDRRQPAEGPPVIRPSRSIRSRSGDVVPPRGPAFFVRTS
jgi:hypothetical protein